MKLLPKLLLLVLAASTLALQGCATRDPRDAPWDPPAGSGRHLIDVLPNWEGRGMSHRTRCDQRARWQVGPSPCR